MSPTSHEPRRLGVPQRVALAAWIGSALEYYDFYLYASAAALVFGKVFFPAGDPANATLLALATFGVGYLARPIGALFMGHMGDRFGRKKVLVFTLRLMGISTFLVGCLPTYEQVGIAAPLMLVVLRLCQGFSASGELAGASAMTIEHAPAHRRALFTSFTLSGTQTGLILATAVFVPIANLPEAELLAWGWRIPFWLSLVILIVAHLIRRSLPESPAFNDVAQRDGPPSLPLAMLFRDARADLVRVLLCAQVAVGSTIVGVYVLSYAVHTLALPRSTMLWVIVASNLVALLAYPLWAIVADRIGRKPVFIVGALSSGTLIFPFLWVLVGRDIGTIFLMAIGMSAAVAALGVWPTFYGEMFATHVRLSGMALGTQIGFAVAGFAPAIAAAFQGDGRHAWLPAACIVGVASLVAAIAAATARETHRLALHELGCEPPTTDPARLPGTQPTMQEGPPPHRAGT
jgi:MFS family permease